MIKLPNWHSQFIDHTLNSTGLEQAYIVGIREKGLEGGHMCVKIYIFLVRYTNETFSIAALLCL